MPDYKERADIVKQCNCCMKMKSASEFYLYKGYRRGQCKECYGARVKEKREREAVANAYNLKRAGQKMKTGRQLFKSFRKMTYSEDYTRDGVINGYDFEKALAEHYGQVRKELSKTLRVLGLFNKEITQ